MSILSNYICSLCGCTHGTGKPCPLEKKKK
jgi:hypothetical protein